MNITGAIDKQKNETTFAQPIQFANYICINKSGEALS